MAFQRKRYAESFGAGRRGNAFLGNEHPSFVEFFEDKRWLAIIVYIFNKLYIQNTRNNTHLQGKEKSILELEEAIQRLTAQLGLLQSQLGAGRQYFLSFLLRKIIWVFPSDSVKHNPVEHMSGLHENFRIDFPDSQEFQNVQWVYLFQTVPSLCRSQTEFEALVTHWFNKGSKMFVSLSQIWIANL